MEKNERRQRKLKLRQAELLVWLGIILIITVLGILIHIKHENSFECHNIYMPDVDGLIVGSPVHMMGIPIGYVNKVKIINDNEIKVRFKITKKTVHIPPGTFATVEFSGLGGSKSLEIYPADSGKIPNEIVGKNSYIMVDRPKRLRDSMALLYQMYKTLMNIIYTSANFSNNLKSIEKPDLIKNTKGSGEDFIDFADKYLDDYEKDMKYIRKMIFKDKKMYEK